MSAGDFSSMAVVVVVVSERCGEGEEGKEGERRRRGKRGKL